jgi:diguanylate cyclase (GGDEF)-like protein
VSWTRRHPSRPAKRPSSPRRWPPSSASGLGGDEFIVRLAGASSEGALGYYRRVEQHLADHPLVVDDGTRVPISISLGIAAYPEHGRSLRR